MHCLSCTTSTIGNEEKSTIKRFKKEWNYDGDYMDDGGFENNAHKKM